MNINPKQRVTCTSSPQPSPPLRGREGEDCIVKRYRDNLSATSLPGERAFSLLEVMIAAAIFFTTIFAVLALVTTNIRNARHLLQPKVDAGLLLADLIQTNKLTEGSDSGDFGDMYKGYQWSSETRNVATNGLWQVDYIVVGGEGKTKAVTTLSAFIYSPLSQAGSSFTK